MRTRRTAPPGPPHRQHPRGCGQRGPERRQPDSADGQRLGSRLSPVRSSAGPGRRAGARHSDLDRVQASLLRCLVANRGRTEIRQQKGNGRDGPIRTQTRASLGLEPNPEPRRTPPNSRRGLRNRRSQVRILSGALRSIPLCAHSCRKSLESMKWPRGAVPSHSVRFRGLPAAHGYISATSCAGITAGLAGR